MRNLTFPIGLYLPDFKERTKDLPIKEASAPRRVVIPLIQHAGIPAKPIVEKNTYVRYGQKIAELQGNICACVHSSVSGLVRDICPWDHPCMNDPVTSIVIESDDKDTKLEPKKILWDYFRYLPEEIVKVISEAGIVGLGGDGFPAHVKLTPPKNIDIDTVILNGCESEPFLTNDDSLMQEYSKEIIDGLKIIMYILNAHYGFIAVEDNKPKAIESLKKVAFTTPNISIKVLKTRYPQGAEKQLVKTITNRTVSYGKSSMDVGIVVHNVSTSYAVYRAVIKGEPLTNRVVTVSGEYVKNPGNYLVRIGTLVSDLLEECGYSPPQVPHKVILGGPMTGITQYTLNVPVVKTTTAVLVLSEDKVEKERMACIKCGKCIEVCPMGLMPLYLCKYSEKELRAKLEEMNISDCIECGCCSYMCPSRRPLVQAIRIGKLAKTKT